MKIHHHGKHGASLSKRVNKNSSVFKALDVSEHSVDGMPVCKHCGLRLSGWQEFRSHILNACPVLLSPDIGADPAAAPVSRVNMPTEGSERLAQRSAAEPLQKQLQADPEHLLKLQGPQWHKLATITAFKSLLKHHCAFCGQWFLIAVAPWRIISKQHIPVCIRLRPRFARSVKQFQLPARVLAAYVAWPSSSDIVAPCCSIYATCAWR